MKRPPFTSASAASNLDYVYKDLGLPPTDTISGSRIPSLQQWGLSDEQAKLICSDAPACVGFSVNPDDWALSFRLGTRFKFVTLRNAFGAPMGQNNGGWRFPQALWDGAVARGARICRRLRQGRACSTGVCCV